MEWVIWVLFLLVFVILVGWIVEIRKIQNIIELAKKTEEKINKNTEEIAQFAKRFADISLESINTLLDIEEILNQMNFTNDIKKAVNNTVEELGKLTKEVSANLQASKKSDDVINSQTDIDEEELAKNSLELAQKTLDSMNDDEKPRIIGLSMAIFKTCASINIYSLNTLEDIKKLMVIAAKLGLEDPASVVSIFYLGKHFVEQEAKENGFI